MTHLQLNQLSSLSQSVTGLQWESVHPLTMPAEQDLAEKLPDIPTLAVLAQDIRNKHKWYLNLPEITVLITGFAENESRSEQYILPQHPPSSYRNA